MRTAPQPRDTRSKSLRIASLAGFFLLCAAAPPALAEDPATAPFPPAISPPPASDPEHPGLAPDAELLLRRTSDVLAAAKTLTLDVEMLREVRLGDGQVTTLASSTALAMRRPDGMRADIRGDATIADVIYDGKRLVVHAVAQRAYAEMPAPGTIDELLPVLQDKLGLPIDVGELLVKDPYSQLAADTSGQVVSPTVINGVAAWHMVLRSNGEPWEFWVRQDETGLPIMASVVRDGLRILYRFDDWRIDPKIDASLFTFGPSQGESQIPFVFRKDTP